MKCSERKPLSVHLPPAVKIESLFYSLGSCYCGKWIFLNRRLSKEVSYIFLRSFFVIIFVVLLVLPTGVLFGSGINQKDDDWTYIGTSKEDVKLYYSPDRTVEHRGLIQSWFKWSYPESDKEIDYNVESDEFNCRKGTYRLLQGALYHRDGRVGRSNNPGAWEHPLPGSLAEMEFRQMCRKTLPRKKTAH